MTTAPDLDHVAVATDDIGATLGTLVGDLGGTVFHGGDGYGFRWVQTRLGSADHGMTVESLVVHEPEVDDFLDRFVTRHGSSPHHVTFKVPDIEAVLDRCRSLGLHPVGVRIDDPQWREAFLQPREAHGTVVQLAQTAEDHELARILPEVAVAGPFGSPRWWPEPPAPGPDPVELQAVVLGTAERATATGFFSGLLGGTVEHEDDARTDVVWPGGGRIRLEDADRAGVLRLDATGATPRTVPLGTVPVVVR